jgi:transposase-like protein
MKKQNLDFESCRKDAAAQLKKGDSLLDMDLIFTPLLLGFMDEALNEELEGHLETDEQPYRENGKGSKSVKTDMGPIEIQTPKDRNGTFEPEISHNELQRNVGIIVNFVPC